MTDPLAVGGLLGVLNELEDGATVNDPVITSLHEFVKCLEEIKSPAGLLELLPRLTLEMTNRMNSPLVDGLYTGYYGVPPEPGTVALQTSPPPIHGGDFFRRVLTTGDYPETVRYFLTQVHPGTNKWDDYLENALNFPGNLRAVLEKKDPLLTMKQLYELYFRSYEFGLRGSIKVLREYARRKQPANRHQLLLERGLDRGFYFCTVETLREGLEDLLAFWRALPERDQWGHQKKPLFVATPLDSDYDRGHNHFSLRTLKNIDYKKIDLLFELVERSHLATWLDQEPLNHFIWLADQPEILERFLDRKLITHQTDDLFRAAARAADCYPAVKLLAEYDNTLIPRLGTQALSIAFKFGSPEAVKFLLDQGARPPLNLIGMYILEPISGRNNSGFLSKLRLLLENASLRPQPRPLIIPVSSIIQFIEIYLTYTSLFAGHNLNGQYLAGELRRELPTKPAAREALLSELREIIELLWTQPIMENATPGFELQDERPLTPMTQLLILIPHFKIEGTLEAHLWIIAKLVSMGADLGFIFQGGGNYLQWLKDQGLHELAGKLRELYPPGVAPTEVLGTSVAPRSSGPPEN